jgi:metal-responsive CopG/Arc/MetJ family transcriptional regulator
MHTLIDGVFNKFRSYTSMRSTRRAVSIGISMPMHILEAIDRTRGEVSRSRYLALLLENSILAKEDRGNNSK